MCTHTLNLLRVVYPYILSQVLLPNVQACFFSDILLSANSFSHYPGIGVETHLSPYFLPKGPCDVLLVVLPTRSTWLQPNEVMISFHSHLTILCRIFCKSFFSLSQSLEYFYEDRDIDWPICDSMLEVSTLVVRANSANYLRLRRSPCIWSCIYSFTRSWMLLGIPGYSFFQGAQIYTLSWLGVQSLQRSSSKPRTTFQKNSNFPNVGWICFQTYHDSLSKPGNWLHGASLSATDILGTIGSTM